VKARHRFNRRGRRAAAGARGFTFVEVLVVVALFSIISVSLFSSFSMGLKVWKMASRPNFAYRKAVLNLERLGRELRQARGYLNTTFQGNDRELTFISVTHEKVFNMTYRFKSEGLWRQAGAVGSGWSDAGEEREMVPDIDRLEFTYYGFDPASKSFVFFDNWDGATQGLPRAVRVVMDLKDETHLEKIMHVPVAL